MSIEAMKLALDALEHGELYKKKTAKAMTALRAAIAEAEKQEPRHIVQSNGRHSPLLTHMMNSRTTPTAAQRPWVGLTDEERMDILLNLNWDKKLSHMVTALAIEAKLKEKNT